ncbi:ribosomal RNA small subunit methyltransferase A [candidate division KSB1 bacterium]
MNIVGNLAYHITSPVLFKLFENRKYINRAYLMVQREVGDRITSPCKTKDRGILSVFSQYYCNVRSLFSVSKNVFYPVPKVDSLFIRFGFLEGSIYQVKDEELFRKVVKLAFGKRRKYLKNSLSEVDKLDIQSLSGEFNFNRRAEELSVQEFVVLSNLIYQKIS